MFLTTPLWGGPSGHLADPTPNTKSCLERRVSVLSEHAEQDADNAETEARPTMLPNAVDLAHQY